MRGCRAIIKRLPIIELSHSQHPGMARTSSVTCGQCSRRNPRGCRCRGMAVGGSRGGGWWESRQEAVAGRLTSALRWTLCARNALRLCGLMTTWSASTGMARASTFCLMPRIGCTSTTPTANQPVKSGLLAAPPLGSPVSSDEPAELLCALERRAGAAQVSTRRGCSAVSARQGLSSRSSNTQAC